MADIVKRTLGRTGYEVTALAYGAMELRGAPRGRHIDPEDAGRILNAVLDGGINMIDTSIDYGVSEELIGRHISPPPERVLSGIQVRLLGHRGRSALGRYATRRTLPPHLHPREYRQRRGAEPAPHEHGPPRPRAVPLQPGGV